MNIELNVNQLRKNLNLSNKAWSIIDSDMDSFNVNVKTLSTFLNTILNNFAEYSKASIVKQKERYKAYLESIKITDLDSINILCNEFEKKLINELESMKAKVNSKRINKEGKFVDCKFKLNIENYDNFEWCKDVRHKYYDGISRHYYNAIFEEYASLPYDQRIKIIYKDILNDIELAQKNKYKLKISYITNENFDFKTDYIPLKYHIENSNIYFIGKRNRKGKIINSGFRIDRITNVKVLNNERFTEADISDLKKEFENGEINSLIDNYITIKVKLNEVGKILFSKQSINRPNLILAEKDHYTIETTEFNFDRYFSTFGVNMEIIEPVELRNKYENKYKKLVSMYSKEN